LLVNENIQFGVDDLLQSNTYKNLRLALVTNDAATTSTGKATRQALLENGYNIIRLFSPEHGIGRTGEDGILQKDGTDALTKLPIISLYSHKLAPNAADFARIDAILFDIPSVAGFIPTYGR
jgi:uncharacterized protein YbbC (DUF1343 family)